MSALPPKADKRQMSRHVCFVPKADSCSAAKSPLFEHLVGEREQLCRHVETECLGGLEIDDELEFRGLHDRQVGGLFTLENATRIKSNLSVLLDQTGPVTDKPTRHDELTIRVHGRNRMACRECSELLHPGVEKNIRTDEQRLVRAWTRLAKAASSSRSVPALDI